MGNDVEYSINCKGRLVYTNEPLIMGILNVTPDSFYDGGSYCTKPSILQRTKQMLSEGAHIIDVGAVSSRPGAETISIEEEWERLQPALSAIRNCFPDALLSIDTYWSENASRSVSEYGADIINDISGGSIDSKMFETVASLRVPYILTHIQGSPSSMQHNPQYEDGVTNCVIADIIKDIQCLLDLGVADVIIDPGFGFGKNLDDNYTLLRELNQFEIFKRPILIGMSRKSMIQSLLNITPRDALNGTTVLNTIALLSGANILRVHDVKECKEAISLVKAYNKNT